MRRVAVTGIGIISAAGCGAGPLLEALSRAAPLGDLEEVVLPRGGKRSVRVARVTRFDPEGLIAAGALRRMSPESRLMTAACVMAWREAGAADRPVPQERAGTFMGSGFGALGTTEEFLRGIWLEGMAAASPQLFSESLASTPLGHMAIALDARGPSMAFAGGDASFLPALEQAIRMVRSGRIDRAVCGSYELIAPELLGVLARLAGRAAEPPPLGEGAVAIVLEDWEAASRLGVRIHAEISSAAIAGDPHAPSTGWSRDPAAWASAYRRAIERSGLPSAALRILYLHAPPSKRSADAEVEALKRTLPEGATVRRESVHAVFGHLAAAGGLVVAAAVLQAAAIGPSLVSAGAWGGMTASAIILP